VELRHLQFFVLVAELESFSRASAEANIAQPALSRYIKKLEDEIGVRLFHRDGRGVRLTDDGAKFYKRVKTVLRHLKRAVAEAQEAQSKPRGELTLGVPAHLGASFIAGLVEEFHALYPEATLNVVEGFSRYIVDWLEIGRVDIGIIYDPRSCRYVSTDLIFKEHLFLVGPVDSALAARETVGLGEVVQLPLIVPNKPSLLLDRIDEAFAQLGARTPTHLSVDCFSAIKRLVRDGKGYTLLSHATVYEEFHRQELAVARVVDPAIVRQLVIGLPPKFVMTLAARKLIELIRTMVAREVELGHWVGEVIPATPGASDKPHGEGLPSGVGTLDETLLCPDETVAVSTGLTRRV